MKDLIKFRTIAEWNEYFRTKDVAAALAEKVSLEGQRIARKRKLTAAEKRRLKRVELCKVIIEMDRARL